MKLDRKKFDFFEPVHGKIPRQIQNYTQSVYVNICTFYNVNLFNVLTKIIIKTCFPLKSHTSNNLLKNCRIA